MTPSNTSFLPLFGHRWTREEAGQRFTCGIRPGKKRGLDETRQGKTGALHGRGMQRNNGEQEEQTAGPGQEKRRRKKEKRKRREKTTFCFSMRILFLFCFIFFIFHPPPSLFLFSFLPLQQMLRQMVAN